MSALTASRRGVLRYLRLEIRRSLRDRRYLTLVVGWPMAAYLLFSTVFGSTPASRSEGLSPKVEIMVAMAAFGAIGAVLIATGPRLASERSSGWLSQLSLTPLSPRRVLAARVMTAMILTLPSIVLTFAVAAAVNGVSLTAGQWLAMTGLISLGCVPFAALGVSLGCLGDGDSVMGLTIALYLAFGALGGLWMPVSVLPAALRTLAHALPSNGVAELGWRLAAGTAPPVSAIVVIAAWLAAATILARGLVGRLSVRH